MMRILPYSVKGVVKQAMDFEASCKRFKEIPIGGSLTHTEMLSLIHPDVAYTLTEAELTPLLWVYSPWKQEYLYAGTETPDYCVFMMHYGVWVKKHEFLRNH